MRSAILAVLCVAFAIRTSGQTPTTYTFLCPIALPVPTEHSELPDTLPALVITSDYYAQPKVLVLHALNNSGKDITGYTIIIRHKNPDGTIEQGGRSETTSDMLPVLITDQMTKDPAASAAHSVSVHSATRFSVAGNGLFLAGTTRDMTLTGIDNGSDMDAIAGVVFYSDGSYDQQDEDAFKRMLANRQHDLQQMKDDDELIRNVLADPANEHPVAAVMSEMNRRSVEEMNKPGPHFRFNLSAQNLQRMQEPVAYGPMKGKTERERLTQYVEEQEKRVELMTPHCHLELKP